MKRLTSVIWVVVGMAATMVGCYNPSSVKEFLNQPRTPVATVDYRVYPPDVLLISSENIKELRPESGRRGLTVPVNPDGKINIPLLGEVIVAGKTLPEIQRALVRAASEYYSESSVEVSVLGFNSQKYYVFGQVGAPGPIPWSGRDTLLDALSRTQPNAYAWAERIILIRGDDPQVGGYARQDEGFEEIDDSKLYIALGIEPEDPRRPRKKMVVNLNAMVRHGDLSRNVLLMPNDVIYVQPHPFAWAGLQLQQFFFPFRQVSDGVTEMRTIFDKNYENNIFYVRD